MSTKVKPIVDMPKHAVIVSSGNHKYVYLTKRTYRNEKGQMKKILLELDKIKVAYDATNEKGYRLINPLTKTQREIIETLGMDETIFNHLVG